MSANAEQSVQPLAAETLTSIREMAALGSHVGVGGKLLTQLLAERDELAALVAGVLDCTVMPGEFKIRARKVLGR